jgi:hypothetical protein
MSPLTDLLDLNKAFRRVNTDRRDDAFPDIVGYRDYNKHLDDNLKLLGEKITNLERYLTGTPLNIDLPKRGFTLRPGIVPLIDDRVTYQAIVDILAPHFVPEPNVYSNRLADKDADHMFIKGVELWIAFQNRVQEYCEQYEFVVETDVTAYFDHISHRLMLSRISDLFGKAMDPADLETIKNLLHKLWERWNLGYMKQFGIPQINDPSSFFGNIYLDELDKWLVAHKITYLRYVDDIRIFAPSEAQGRKTLAALIVKIREMGLYVAAGKTKIRPTRDVKEELTKGRNQINEIEADIESKDPERMSSAADKLQDFFLRLVNDPKAFDDRLFRYCVNRFKRLYVSGLGLQASEQVIREIILRLDKMPESTDVFVDYLSLFSTHEDLQISVLNFLEGEYNIYAWQEMLLLELLLRLNLHPPTRLRASQYANTVVNSAKHAACKAKAYLLLGKYGTYATRRDIRAQYEKEDSQILKRAIIVAIQEMKEDERNNFYKNIAPTSRDVGQTINYIKGLGAAKYYYYKPPAPYEIDFPEDDSDDLSDLGSEYFV